MLNKNVIIMMFALTLAAPAAFGQSNADASAAEEHKVETRDNKAKVGELLNGIDPNSTAGKVKEGQKKADQVEDAAAKVDTDRQGQMDSTTLRQNEQFFSHAGNTVKTVADATQADEMAQINNGVKTIQLDPNAKAIGFDAQLARNVQVLAKWNRHNALAIEKGVQLLLKVHSEQIAQLDSATQAEIGKLIRDEMAKAYAMGYADDSDIDPSGNVETYILNVNGNLQEMTRAQQVSFFKSLRESTKAQRDDTLRAAHNKESIMEEEASEIKAATARLGRTLTAAEIRDIQKTSVTKLIEAHHNLNPDDPNDPTKMTKQQISDLADEILAKKC